MGPTCAGSTPRGESAAPSRAVSASSLLESPRRCRAMMALRLRINVFSAGLRVRSAGGGTCAAGWFTEATAERSAAESAG